MLPVTYLRSSSLGDFSWCENKYAAKYVLGLKDKPNKKAQMGTVVHKCMEVLGNAKLAKQNGEDRIKDEVFDHSLEELEDLDLITRLSFDYYNKHEPELDMTEKECKICRKWLDKALAFQGGIMDPRKQNIHATEVFFELDLPEWAEYDYQIGDVRLKGRGQIKGTVDLVCRESDVYFQVVDYKTGQRLNWTTGEVKNQEDFEKDPQLLLYYYALRNIYPDNKFFMSIYFINHGGQCVVGKDGISKSTYPDEGGIFSVAFDDHDYEKAERMLKERFQAIRNTKIPSMLSPSNSHWKCKYLCKFSEQSTEDPSKTTCQFLNGYIRDNGIEDTILKYGDISKLTSYGEGGGRVSKD